MSTLTRRTTMQHWARAEAVARDVHQTRHWAELDVAMHADDPGEPLLLHCDLADGDVWVPVVRRRVAGRFAVLSSPYGYPGLVRADGTPVSAPELAAALLREARAVDACALVVRLHPVLDAGVEATMLPTMATVGHGPTVSIDLRHGCKAAWTAMRSRTRGHVRRALRDGFVPRLDAWAEDFAGFRRAYDDSMTHHHADELYRLDDTYWARLRQLAPDHLRLLTVRAPDGGVAAGAVVTQFGRIATYHLGGTRTAHRGDHLLELLLWEAARAVAPHSDLLHLGGGVGAQQDGLYQLKHGLGRLEHRFRTLRLIADPAAYAAMSNHDRAGVLAPWFPHVAAR